MTLLHTVGFRNFYFAGGGVILLGREGGGEGGDHVILK